MFNTIKKLFISEPQRPIWTGKRSVIKVSYTEFEFNLAQFRYAV